MKRISLTIAAVAAAALVGSEASAQSMKPVSLGISAGAAIPAGNLADDYNTGFNGTLSLGFNSVGTPLGIRVDGMYNQFGGRDDVFGDDSPDFRIMGANANLVFSLPGQGIQPYLIGGGGVYSFKPQLRAASSETDFGVNAGIGAAFPLSGFNTFIEARFHHIFSDDESQFVPGGAKQFVPVTFGISF